MLPMEDRERLSKVLTQAEFEACRASFRYFLRYWSFLNRETGAVGTMENLWPGQERFAALMAIARWIIDLKAGKQGHSEIESAYDFWASWSGPAGNRVHIFSDGEDEAREFLEIVKFGIVRLPAWFGVTLLDREPGGNTTRSLRYRLGPDDVRTIAAYPARPGASINQSAWHVHCDELSKMQFGEGVLGGIQTTIAEGGSLHIISRGRTAEDAMAVEWERALDGMEYEQAHEAALAAVRAGNLKRVVPLFVDYTGRPGRDAAWREAEAKRLSPSALRHYAPIDPSDALSGDADAVFVEEGQWDTLETVAPIEPGDHTPMVLALDAGVRSDFFALVGATRCPNHDDEAAIRYVKVWKPNPIVDFAEVKVHLRQMFEDYNIVCVTYDKYALEDMAQELGRERWWDSYDQGARRLVGDAAFRQRIVERRLARIQNDDLRAAVVGAGIKLDKDEKKLRIVKRTATKIDAAVAAAMCCDVTLTLNL